MVVQGTTIGTITGVDGTYNVTVPASAEVLEFHFMGMESQEIAIGTSTVINVVMVESAIGLEEVVVTSLGITKQKKALGYSVTQIDGEGLTESREINLGNALAGKVAGVNVSNAATGPGGSSRVVIRGNASISGANQPLYVVDGIPIDNRQLGAAGMWGGQDWGDGISSLNPDDIESISVLKGNTAAALYGSRAANGVILITTKKGERRKGVGVEINSNWAFDKVSG